MRFPIVFFATIPFLGALGAACGGNVVAGTGSSGSSGTGAGTTTSGAGGDTVSTGCPPAEPTAGAACSPEGAACTYGNSVLAECRSLFSCAAGAWAAEATSCPAPTPGCPSSEPPKISCDADAGSGLCPYPDGALCACGACPPFAGICSPGPPMWFCESPNGPSGCPQIIPNEGTACSSAGLACFYPSASCGRDVTCTDGVWGWQQHGCAA